MPENPDLAYAMIVDARGHRRSSTATRRRSAAPPATRSPPASPQAQEALRTVDARRAARTVYNTVLPIRDAAAAVRRRGGRRRQGLGDLRAGQREHPDRR